MERNLTLNMIMIQKETEINQPDYGNQFKKFIYISNHHMVHLNTYNFIPQLYFPTARGGKKKV